MISRLSESALHVKLPALRNVSLGSLLAFELLVILILSRIPFELDFMPQRDHSQQHPLYKWPSHFEVRASRIVALAGALYRRWPTIAAPSILRVFLP
jgi:hypothetical protein